MAKPERLSLHQVLEKFQPGMTVFVPGMSGESLSLAAALRERPAYAEGVRFVGALFPGINRTDYLGLHAGARQRAYFMSPGLRPGLADGRAELMPLDYPGVWRDLVELPRIDIAFAQVTPPDAQGRCSLGPCSDFHPAAWNRAALRIAHINSQLPRTTGSFHIEHANIDAVFEADHAVLEYPSDAPGEAMRRHAELVASLVRDGDTLEFGVGKLQAGILAALAHHRDLRVWSGMASAPVLPLLDQGVIAGPRAVQIGVALGDAAFYARIGRDETFYFRPVSQTHDVRRIAAIDRFCAINSAIEVDLFGQVNADSLNGKLVAGVGGLPAFAAGAALSTGGRSIIALPSATDDGRHTRIVARLSGHALGALPRHTADYVVTEQGLASLRGLSVHQRAAALIEIAAPAFRESLAASWAEIAKGL